MFPFPSSNAMSAVLSPAAVNSALRSETKFNDTAAVTSTNSATTCIGASTFTVTGLAVDSISPNHLRNAQPVGGFVRNRSR